MEIPFEVSDEGNRVPGGELSVRAGRERARTQY
jgi:hypothetical protein